MELLNENNVNQEKNKGRFMSILKKQSYFSLFLSALILFGAIMPIGAIFFTSDVYKIGLHWLFFVLLMIYGAEIISVYNGFSFFKFNFKGRAVFHAGYSAFLHGFFLILLLFLFISMTGLSTSTLYKEETLTYRNASLAYAIKQRSLEAETALLGIEKTKETIEGIEQGNATLLTYAMFVTHLYKDENFVPDIESAEDLEDMLATLKLDVIRYEENLMRYNQKTEEMKTLLANYRQEPVLYEKDLLLFELNENAVRLNPYSQNKSKNTFQGIVKNPNETFFEMIGTIVGIILLLHVLYIVYIVFLLLFE